MTTDVRASLGAASALDTIFAPVHSQTAFEEAVERLGTAIRLGLLPPGTRLPARRCARRWSPSARAATCTPSGVAAEAPSSPIPYRPRRPPLRI
jgi:hypothetical protein